MSQEKSSTSSFPDGFLPSRFLPSGFNPSEPIALLAGRGLYPQMLAERIRRSGCTLKLVTIGTETDACLVDTFPPSDRLNVGVGQLGRLLKILRFWKVRYALLAGQITPGRLFRGLRPDWKAVRVLSGLKERNAHTLFGAIVAEMESIGVTTLDARCFLDDQLVSTHDAFPGCLRPRPAEIAHAIRVARAMAAEDIGQAVVTAKGTVLAIEDFNGTDALLERVASFPVGRKILTKVAKPNHDFRFDVPVLGPASLDRIHRAGIRHLLLDADRLLLIQKQALISRFQKDRVGLSVIKDGD